MAQYNWEVMPEQPKGKRPNPSRADGRTVIGGNTFTKVGTARRRAASRARQRARYTLRAMYPEEWSRLVGLRDSEARADTALRSLHPEEFLSLQAAARSDEAVLGEIPELQEAVARYMAGELAHEVAERFGIGVALLARVCPEGAKAEHQRARRVLEIEAFGIRDEVEAVRRMWMEGIRCRVCWGLMTPHRYATCSQRCADLWKSVRYQLDEHERQSIQIAMAKRKLLTGEGSQAWSRNVLAGTVTTRGRWTITGSASERAVAEVKRLRAENFAMFGEPRNPLPNPV